MSKLAHRLGGSTGAAAALLGLAMLGLWQLGDWRTATFGPDYVPMAPITAVLFVLLGSSQVARTLKPASRAVGWLEIGAAAVGFAVAVAVARQTLHYFPLPWDRWFAMSVSHVGQIPVGRMSPLTAAAFLLSSVALLAKSVPPPPASTPPAAETESPQRSRRTACRWICFLAASTSLAIGFVVLVGYAAGTPPNYSGQSVPMALLTAVGLVLVNSSLLLNGTERLAVTHWLGLESSEPARAHNRKFTRRLVVLAGLIGGLIAVAGLVYMRTEQQAARDSIRAVLESVANLKTAQIASWREERLGEGRFLQRTPNVAADIATFLDQPGDPAARARVLGWLEPIKAGERYEAVLLFDAAGALRLNVGDSSVLPINPRELLRPGVSGPAVALGDLERDPESGRIHLDVRVPVLPPAGAGAPIATLVLRLNPNYFLFPLIRQWPVPSSSAETLLVRREGDEIVFLNELRHNPSAPLSIRRSVNDPDLLGAMAVRGSFDFGEGHDYRGVSVIGTTRKIRDSSWFLVAKLDQDEVFAPIRREAWQSGLSLVLLLLALALAAAFVWRQQHSLTLQRSLEAEQKRLALAERLSLVMRYANDIILILDDKGSIVEASERALAVYGYTLDELRALPPGGLRAAGTEINLAADLTKLLAPTGSRFETLHRRKDGSVFPVEVSGRGVELDGRRLIFGIYRDITERKVHEEQVGRLNRLYTVLSQVNVAIVHSVNREGLLPRLALTPGPANAALAQAMDRDALLRHICRVLVEFGGFRMAWIGWLDPETQQVRLAAEYGDETGYLKDIRVFADHRPEAQGPTGTAIREERPDVCNDVATEARMAPWREAAGRAGYRSTIGLPLRLHGKTCGALTVYATEPRFFGREEIALLQDAAMDLTFGLEALEREEQRRRLTEELRRRELELIEAQRVAHLGNWWFDLKTGAVTWSEPLYRMLGLDPTQPPPPFPEHHRLFMPESWRQLEAAVARLTSTGVPYELELEMARNGVSAGWMWVRGEPVRDAQGTLIALRGVSQDITSRKQAEARLNEQLDELRHWHDATLGREERIMELKGEVNELLQRTGKPARYANATPPKEGGAHA